MKIRKYHLTVSNIEEIPKTGDIGYHGIESNFTKRHLLGESPIDVDITSRESIYDSFKHLCSGSYLDYLKSYLKTNFTMILPGLQCEYSERSSQPQLVRKELFSTLKDNPEFTQFRKDNNYPESSYSLNESHRPLTYKDMNFLSSLSFHNENFERNKMILQPTFCLLRGEHRFSKIYLAGTFHTRYTWFSVGESKNK